MTYQTPSNINVLWSQMSSLSGALLALYCFMITDVHTFNLTHLLIIEKQNMRILK